MSRLSEHLTPPPRPAQFTFAELAACAEREAKYRHWVYPRRVADRKLSQQNADRELAMMEAMAEYFRALSNKTERLV